MHRCRGLEEDVSVAAAEATGALEAVKVTAVVLIGLLVWPPLAVIPFTIVVPFLVAALILGSFRRRTCSSITSAGTIVATCRC